MWIIKKKTMSIKTINTLTMNNFIGNIEEAITVVQWHGSHWDIEKDSEGKEGTSSGNQTGQQQNAIQQNCV